MEPELAHLSVDVVLGQQSIHLQSVKRLVDLRSHTTLHESLPSLAGLIARADMAVGAGGATTWERLCLGLPSLVVAMASNQLQFSKALHDAGYIKLIGDSSSVSMFSIKSQILTSIKEGGFFDNSPRLVDGFGVSRLADLMVP